MSTRKRVHWERLRGIQLLSVPQRPLLLLAVRSLVLPIQRLPRHRTEIAHQIQAPLNDRIHFKRLVKSVQVERGKQLFRVKVDNWS